MSIPSEMAARLAEQRRYYVDRAAEYDEWWERRGRYDRGEGENELWRAEVATVQAAVDAAVPADAHVLELAGGSGNWTLRLARRAASVTVIDAAAEMIAINSERLRAAGLIERLRYRQQDLFDWAPEQHFDVLFAGFFLSHVPAALLDGFLDRIAAALGRGGRLVLVDSRRQPRSSSADQAPPPPESEVARRVLNDGRQFEIIKRFDTPDDLRDRLAARGIAADVRTTALHFIYAVGLRS